MNPNGVILSNPEIQGGIPCFTGTRVPVKSLFDHLKEDYSVDEFLEDFPTVSRAQIEAVLNLSADHLSAFALSAAAG